jgi:hypothetical protein
MMYDSCLIDFPKRATVPSLYLQYTGRKGALGLRVTGRTASHRIPSGAFLQVLQPKAPNTYTCNSLQASSQKVNNSTTFIPFIIH